EAGWVWGRARKAVERGARSVSCTSIGSSPLGPSVLAGLRLTALNTPSEVILPRNASTLAGSYSSPFKEGELYDPAKVEALRGKITSLGVFNAVSLKPASTLGPNGELPIEVQLTDRAPRSTAFRARPQTQPAS